MISTLAPRRRQKSCKPLDRLRVRALRRRQDAPAVFEQLGEAGVGPGIFGAGDRMGGNEMHAFRQVRRHLGDDRAP